MCCKSLSTVFFYKLILNHGDLHSFPTRRSSDLTPGFRSMSAKPTEMMRYTSIRSGTPRTRLSGSWTWTVPQRSEEHTSELQSLTNLVCRLLLEKKKRKRITERWSNKLCSVHLIC